MSNKANERPLAIVVQIKKRDCYRLAVIKWRKTASTRILREAKSNGRTFVKYRNIVTVNLFDH